MAGNGKSVVFVYEFISALSAVECEVVVRELVAFEALMSSTVRAAEDGYHLSRPVVQFRSWRVFES